MGPHFCRWLFALNGHDAFHSMQAVLRCAFRGGAAVKQRRHLIAFLTTFSICTLCLQSVVGQVSPEEHEALLANVRGYLREGRTTEALAVLRRIQAARPDNKILSQIGGLYFQLGMFTEAKDAFAQLLLQDGEVQVPVREHTTWSYRWGNLSFTKERVRWQSVKETENFDMPFSDVKGIYVVSKGGPTGGAGSMFDVEFDKKVWFFSILYGNQPGKDGMKGVEVFWGANHAENDRRAREFLVLLMRQAASNSLVALPQKKAMDISPGMSREEVIRVLGEPQRTITFGNKTILKYADLTIELVDGKVVDVKVN